MATVPVTLNLNTERLAFVERNWEERGFPDAAGYLEYILDLAISYEIQDLAAMQEEFSWDDIPVADLDDGIPF